MVKVEVLYIFSNTVCWFVPSEKLMMFGGEVSMVLKMLGIPELDKVKMPMKNKKKNCQHFLFSS